jgi:hypothetical protein
MIEYLALITLLIVMYYISLWDRGREGFEDDKTETVYNSLTEVLEAWFEKNQEKAEFRLAPLDSKVYVIRTESKTPEPPKRYNIYGDY